MPTIGEKRGKEFVPATEKELRILCAQLNRRFHTGPRPLHQVKKAVK